MTTRIPSRELRDEFRSTRPLHDFHGGIHPPENKALSNSRPIRRAPLPDQLVLPLNMHLGAPAKALVSVGDKVLKGEKIADAQGTVSVPVHAPTSGTVVAVGMRPIQHPSGLEAPCIVIEPDGKETWTELHPLPHWLECSPAALLARIREAGIAGMGGAGFPSAVKLNLREGAGIEQLVINAVECEPYITADDLLMRERAGEIVAGVRILEHLLNPDEVLIGIEDNKPEAISAMRAACADTGFEVLVVPTKYPSGGEKQLVQLLTGKEIPAGGIPAQVGVVCHNIGTAVAIHRAVERGEPLITRITTLTGQALAEPGNLEVLIGTPVRELLAFAGADTERTERLIMGGPMMGFSIHTPSVPVVKTSNCIIAATVEELPPPPPEQPCIRCGSCAEVCPADLLPQQLYWYSKSSDLERAQQYNLMDCIECGACAYVCPSNIPLVQYYRHAKGEVRQQVADQQKADRARERFEARQARLEQEAAEKAARRKARLAASSKKTSAAPSADTAALKKASLEASAAYKAAVKALKTAEAEGQDDIAGLRAESERLKAVADAAKAAVRDARSAAPAGAAAEDPVATLKKAVGEASAAYKAAVKAAKAAEENGDADAAEKRQQADQLKIRADELKAELREAKANAPASTAAAAAPAEAAPTKASGEDERQAAEKRAQKMKALKTAYNMANKQWKEASAALERAQRDGHDDTEALQKKVDKLRFKADTARDALNVLVDEAKRNIEAASGSDLKTLKLEAARTEKAARDKDTELEQAKKAGDQGRIDVLYKERDALRQEAETAANALKSAVADQGLND